MVTIAEPLFRLVRDGIILANKEQFEKVDFVPSAIEGSWVSSGGKGRDYRVYVYGKTASGEELKVPVDDLRNPEMGKPVTVWLRLPDTDFYIRGASTRIVGDAHFDQVTVWRIVKLSALVASMIAVGTFAGRRLARIGKQRQVM